MSSSQKVQSADQVNCVPTLVKQQEKGQVIQQSVADTDKNLSLSYIRQQAKSQNPKIGRPAKTDQEQQFKKYYLENKQKFQLQCELLVFVHQSYFDQIIDNPINTRVNKAYMDRLFISNQCQMLYRTLLRINQRYFKRSSDYPQQRLKYTSILDVAYMTHTVKLKYGNRMSAIQLLLIIFFFLFNQKLMNHTFYEYFINNLQKFRQGMIFGPGGKNGPKLQKLDKLIICLALTIADLQKVQIQQEVIYSEEQYSQSQYQDDQQQEKQYKQKQERRQYLQPMQFQHLSLKNQIKPKKKIHSDN